MSRALLRTKPLERIMNEAAGSKEGGMKRVLGALDLTAIGVGAIIGAGIFVLTGTAAKTAAGPSIMVSYLFAGVACILAALCYAEFATRMPISGSAYTYAYATVGELCAWIIGWDLILEYTIGASAVAVGWTHYLQEFIQGFGTPEKPVDVPAWLIDTTIGPFHINVAACLLIIALTTLLCIGVKESARFNGVMVAVKLCVVLFVIVAGYKWVQPANWHPFAPFGASGIVHGAALIFFAYIGFDAVSTAAEEVKDPNRDLPIGIIASLVICTILYVAVSATVTGMVPYQNIDAGAPLAAAFGDVGEHTAQRLIGLGGFVGLTTVVLVLLMSQPRIWFAMARDGLLWPWFSRIHPKTRTPMNATMLAGTIALLMAALVPMDELHHMVSIGTLFAFVVVSGSILVLRYKSPENPSGVVNQTLTLAIGLGILSFGLAAFMDGSDSSLPVGLKWALTLVGAAVALVPTLFMFRQPTLNPPTTFRCPLVPAVPILAMAGNIFMMVKLDPSAWVRLFVWLIIGFAIYFLYGRDHSKLDPSYQGDPDAPPEHIIPDATH
jgi:APA family basic amino acid/polyamine antiporter